MSLTDKQQAWVKKFTDEFILAALYGVYARIENEIMPKLTKIHGGRHRHDENDLKVYAQYLLETLLQESMKKLRRYTAPSRKPPRDETFDPALSLANDPVLLKEKDETKRAERTIVREIVAQELYIHKQFSLEVQKAARSSSEHIGLNS